MHEGLIDRIRQVGYWRINLRPKSRLPEDLSFQRCAEIVEQSRVSIRGWDFPHIVRRHGDDAGVLRRDNYIEHWIEWDWFREFWRMYKSGQFLSYKALNEDIRAISEGNEDRQMNIVSSIYSVTEFAEFAQRIANEKSFGGEVILSISLFNSLERQLAVGHNRVPFFEPKTSHSDVIDVPACNFYIGGGEDEARENSHRALLYIFDYFGWNPDEAQISADQEKFYRREF